MADHGVDCIFCKIAQQEIPAKICYEDETVVAFSDLNPQAPTHLLIIPRKHVSTLNDLTDDDIYTVGYMVKTAQKLAKEMGHNSDGYRLVMNCNEHGGQTVFHIHLHFLAGRHFDWPPG
jgi:histidine triad (HIT) family protein